MSCETLSQGSTGLQVSMASLPEGFCPASMQELANAIAERLIVSPNQSFTSFATGSIEPSSNVGPWLKDCLTWFVFDDATARYIPIQKGGFDTQQYFIVSGTFVVPSFISKLKITAFGAGGGGFSAGATAAAGGGGGAAGISIVAVTPGQSINYTIGTGGIGGAPGGTGGTTTILSMIVSGGTGGTAITASGLGGTSTGCDINLTGQAGQANITSSGVVNDSQGGDAAAWGGKGGVGATGASTVGRNGTSPGGGGSGSNSGAVGTPGNGADGAILIEY